MYNPSNPPGKNEGHTQLAGGWGIQKERIVMLSARTAIRRFFLSFPFCRSGKRSIYLRK
jgi:hypothetical protein